MIAYFIRHGRTEHPRDQAGVPLVYGPEASLTPEGKARIVEIAGSILHREGRPFDRLVASPYQRALQTARIIAEVMGLDPGKIITDPRLRDTDSTWPGRPVAEFQRAWRERTVFDDPHTCETLDQLRERMTAAVNYQAGELEGGLIGFIVHGDPLRAWLFPPDKPFPAYGELVRATFDAEEGVRMVWHADGAAAIEITADLVRMRGRAGALRRDPTGFGAGES